MNYRKLAYSLSEYARYKKYDLQVGMRGSQFTVKESLLSVVLPIYLGRTGKIAHIKHFYQDALYWLEYTGLDIHLSYTSLAYFDIVRNRTVTQPIQEFWSQCLPDKFLLGVDVRSVERIGVDPSKPLSAHTLVSGITGSGKSYTLMGMMLTYLYATSPENCEVYLIDFKNQNLPPFSDLPHVASYANTTEDALRILAHISYEIDLRKFKPSNKRVILVVDELAELLQHGGIEASKYLQTICRLGRELNVTVLAATQKPSSKSIGDQVYAQFSQKVTGRLKDAAQASAILGVQNSGAETLNKTGVMLDVNPYTKPRKFLSFHIDHIYDHIDTVKLKWADYGNKHIELLSVDDAQIILDAKELKQIFQTVFVGGKIEHGGYQKMADVLGVEYRNTGRDRVRNAVQFLIEQVNDV